MNQDDDTPPPIAAATEGVEMIQILGQGTEDGIPLLDLPPSKESNEIMDESSPGNSNGSPVMPPENSTQEGTASEVRANANSQELFAVTRTTETRNVLLVVVGIFASACFTTVCNMPAKLLEEN
ncbi:hypothetical protein WN944_024642 [Citrus x changshan-huyou]|uniref:Uncharacterized protein n=1 Tax=Citrus x changshan-huyou TaxID=2935761 RepID=A0AAP0QCS9_9ROSI